MRQSFFAFVKKELLHIMRDPLTLIIMFGIPIVQVVLFGYAITTDVKKAELAIVDNEGNNRSREIIDELVASAYFEPELVLHSTKELESAFRKNQVKIALVIPQGFDRDMNNGKASLQLIADASDPNTANLLVTYASGILQRWSVKKAVNLGVQSSLMQSQGNVGMGGPPLIRTEVRMHYNPELRSVLMFVPGIVTIILMLVSATLTSISIAREKELGTMEVLLSSPLPPQVIIIGKVLPYLALSMINAVVVLTVGYFIFEVPINGNLALLLTECLLFVMTALSLGVLISTIAASQQVALMLSLFALMMPTILLSGFIYPISSMPVLLRILSHIIPARYFIEILRSIMLKGVGLRVIWPQTITLMGMTMLFIGMSVKRFKIRLA